jgi:hypothetical protein
MVHSNGSWVPCPRCRPNAVTDAELDAGFKAMRGGTFTWPDGQVQAWDDMSNYDLCIIGACDTEKRWGAHASHEWWRRSGQVEQEARNAERDELREYMGGLVCPMALVCVARDHFRKPKHCGDCGAFLDVADSKDRDHHDVCWCPPSGDRSAQEEVIKLNGNWEIDPKTAAALYNGGKRERVDAPSYGGWSEGDVMAYLSRFGEVKDVDGHFYVRSGKLFDAVFVRFDKWRARVWIRGESLVVAECEEFSALPEAMQWAVQRWRELVAESDPLPDVESGSIETSDLGQAATRHIGTGDMGQRSTWAGGFGGRDD